MFRRFIAALLATAAVATGATAGPETLKYTDLCVKVVAGETVKVAVGIPATGDRWAISNPPAAVPPGNYVCRYDGVGLVLWTPEVAPAPAQAPVFIGGGCPGGVCPVRR